jgi:hypothetical protein
MFGRASSATSKTPNRSHRERPAAALVDTPTKEGFTKDLKGAFIRPLSIGFQI